MSPGLRVVVAMVMVMWGVWWLVMGKVKAESRVSETEVGIVEVS
jgi:hypothetical protein